jgi:hypothetical protein
VTTASEHGADQPENQQHDEDDDEDVGDAHAWPPTTSRLSNNLFNLSSAYSSVRTLSALGERAASARAISSSLYASEICTSSTSNGSAVFGTSLTSNPTEHDADSNDRAHRDAGDLANDDQHDGIWDLHRHGRP